MSLRRFVLGAFVCLPLVTSACSTEVADEDTSVTEDALRALLPEEVLGSLAYGETRTFEYTFDSGSKVRYRAYSFEAKAGETIDLWVRSADGGDARVWLLGSRYQTLTSNDDAAPGNKDAHITRKLGSTGRHYIAMRDSGYDDATFTLSLEKKCLPNDPTCQGNGNPSDPFDPSSCSGPAISAAQVTAMLDLPNGVVSKKVGRWAFQQRERACYPGQACSAWRAGSRPVTAPFERLNRTFTTAAASRYHVKSAGDVVAEMVSNQARLTFTGDLTTEQWGSSFTQDYLKNAFEVTLNVAAGSLGAPFIEWTYMPSLGCPNGHCAGNANIPGTSPTSWAGKAFAFSTVKATKSCVHLSAAASEETTDASNNGFTLESQIVLRGDFQNATCQAKTCADYAAACGTVDDGCGSQIACGTCGTNQTCEKNDGPNHCRAMTAVEQCSASGRVFCPGHGGCWDACY